MTGILYGIGVGVGGPDSLTLAAVKYIENSDILLLPQEKEKCYAYQIVKQAVSCADQKEMIVLSFPMTKEEAALQQAMEANTEVVCGLLEQGKTLAFLTIGDPAVYATYMYLQRSVDKRGYITKMISGVPSFCAVAAKLGISLGEQEEEIHIIPASYEISHTMAYQGTRIYMKAGRKLGLLCQMLEKEQKERKKQGEELQIYAVSDCGLASEKLMYGLEELTSGSYLTIVIVKRKTIENICFDINAACSGCADFVGAEMMERGNRTK